MANRKFWFVLLISVGGIALAGDALLGRINDTSEVRISARQFREEAASLELPTKNLIPNIEHVYRDWNASDSSNQDSSAKIRGFQIGFAGHVGRFGAQDWVYRGGTRVPLIRDAAAIGRWTRKRVRIFAAVARKPEDWAGPVAPVQRGLVA